ncbi:MAG: LysE family transporter [Anaerolineae bacterium]
MLVRGLALGFSIAAPVGPIGVLCIRRTLAHGRMHGFVSGMGAASADAIFGLIAAFGLTVISQVLIDYRDYLGFFGGLFLIYLGAKTLRARPAEISGTGGGAATDHETLWGAYLSTLFLALTNPITILFFTAVFAGLGAAELGGGGVGSVVLVVGVFTGSAIWWTILSGGTSLLRGRFNARMMLWVNRFSGVIILGFGCIALLSLLT